ncbi:hypothetical protein V5T82_13605 [Magnetovibrio sp. PR-2]|uniref:hypothetical protein n=1 Tax=Magnetovibrio sp. PR-2 TaxID=3120356 RepID=UPI002FCE487B
MKKENRKRKSNDAEAKAIGEMSLDELTALGQAHLSLVETIAELIEIRIEAQVHQSIVETTELAEAWASTRGMTLDEFLAPQRQSQAARG